MVTAAVATIRARTRRVRNRFAAGCLVLCYHRVGTDTNDRWRNAVSAERFDAHLATLRRLYRIVSVGELVESLERGRPPARRTVAITFDDGYAVNMQRACPILLQHRAPATFYLNTAWLGGEPFWWDQLAHNVDTPERAGRVARALAADGAAPLSDGSPEALAAALRAALKTMGDGDRRALLRRMDGELGPVHHDRPEYQPMTAADVRTLAAEPLFTIGGHTHTHPALAQVSAATQREEIRENRRILEALAGRPVTHFSYPFGGPHDFDDITTAELRSAGFRSAATTLGGPVRWPCDTFRIPRVSVKNWDAAKFEAEVEEQWAR